MFLKLITEMTGACFPAQAISAGKGMQKYNEEESAGKCQLIEKEGRLVLPRHALSPLYLNI